jgi:hypothetical protein
MLTSGSRVRSLTHHFHLLLDIDRLETALILAMRNSEKGLQLSH